MTEAQAIDTAPRNGGWVLGLVQPSGWTDANWQPWKAVTWGDSGWVDDNGNECSPVAWVPLPDPQPRPTGWRPAEGTIRVTELTGDGWTDGKGNPVSSPFRWVIDIERSDGTFDEYRDCDFRVTREQAEAIGAKWATKYGLPVKLIPLPTGHRKVIPFCGGRDADG